MDGTLYNVTPNAHNGTSLYNGGEKGWGRQTWDIAVHINNSITFVLFDNRWNGFPGIFASCVTHTVTPYEWRIAFGVTPLLKAGPINLSQQVFFNLGGFRPNASDTVLDHKLHLPVAGMRFDVDDRGIPTGDIRSNRERKDFDFWSTSKSIGEEIQKQGSSFDVTYALSHKPLGAKEDDPVAILSSHLSGITMELYTDQDALHVHTWDGKISNKIPSLGVRVKADSLCRWVEVEERSRRRQGISARCYIVGNARLAGCRPPPRMETPKDHLGYGRTVHEICDIQVLGQWAIEDYGPHIVKVNLWLQLDTYRSYGKYSLGCKSEITNPFSKSRYHEFLLARQIP